MSYITLLNNPNPSYIIPYWKLPIATPKKIFIDFPPYSSRKYGTEATIVVQYNQQHQQSDEKDSDDAFSSREDSKCLARLSSKRAINYRVSALHIWSRKIILMTVTMCLCFMIIYSSLQLLASPLIIPQTLEHVLQASTIATTLQPTPSTNNPQSIKQENLLQGA